MGNTVYICLVVCWCTSNWSITTSWRPVCHLFPNQAKLYRLYRPESRFPIVERLPLPALGCHPVACFSFGSTCVKPWDEAQCAISVVHYWRMCPHKPKFSWERCDVKEVDGICFILVLVSFFPELRCLSMLWPTLIVVGSQGRKIKVLMKTSVLHITQLWAEGVWLRHISPLPHSSAFAIRTCDTACAAGPFLPDNVGAVLNYYLTLPSNSSVTSTGMNILTRAHWSDAHDMTQLSKQVLFLSIPCLSLTQLLQCEIWSQVQTLSLHLQYGPCADTDAVLHLVCIIFSWNIRSSLIIELRVEPYDGKPLAGQYQFRFSVGFNGIERPLGEPITRHMSVDPRELDFAVLSVSLSLDSFFRVNSDCARVLQCVFGKRC